MRGSIEKRSGSWTIKYYLPPDIHGRRKQKRETLPGVTKKEAERILAERIAQIERGQYFEPENITLREFFGLWLEHVKQRVRPTTYVSYRTMVGNHIVPDLGHINITQLRPAHIQDLYTLKLFDGRVDGKGSLSGRSIQYIHHILKAALNQAAKWEMIHSNPAIAVDPPRVSKPPIQYWTPEQSKAFLAHVRDHRNYALYRLAITCGLRQGELLGLMWEDIQEDYLSVRRSLVRGEGGSVHLSETKTSSGVRTVALGPEDQQALRAHRVKQAEERLQAGSFWDDYGLVFPSNVGTPMSHRNVLRQFKKLAKEAELPPIRFHDLRHTCATLLLSAGVNPKVVQERLGHSRITTTIDTYSHLLPNMQKEAADALSAMLQDQTKTK